jgi:hypothetical protein
MKTISEIRRANIRLLVEQRGGLTKLSRILGYKNPSFLSQMLSETGATREVTERTARKIEEALGLPADQIDQPPEDPIHRTLAALPVKAPVEPPQAQSADGATLAENAIRAVGAACEAEGVQMSTSRFAELVALVYSDAIERGVRPERVTQLVRLLR